MSQATVETAPHLPTYADIERLPEHVVGEIIAGELVVSPRPAPPHALAASRLGGLLNTRFELGLGGPGGWWIHHEPELSLGVDPRYDPVVPDLGGWRVESMPDLPVTAQYRVTPDWVCEVLSPGTARRDRSRKLPFYIRAGVGHVWLLDPVEQTLEVYEPDATGIRVVGIWSAGDQVSAPPFEALPIDLTLLWPPGAGAAT